MSGRVGDRASVLGCEIDRLDMGQTLEACKRAIAAGDYLQHMAINAAKLVAYQDDPRLREIVRECGLVNADGQAVVWASKLLGDPLPTRVAGVDLMQELLGLAATEGYGVYILGARPEVLGRAIDVIRETHPGLRIAGYRDGYFDDAEVEDVARAIASSRAEILFVAMSSPRKEYFLGAYGPRLGVPLVMGVGGSIDVIAGVTTRAPALMQRMGLEWLFRLLQEPRRLATRYISTNARFVALVLRERFRRRR
ncbi:MAG TPA: WecB/TagA/CpsF family glycosyltransferase [Thermoleophilaceae bacterium]|nr:WecB/TagA/CpsF family glycosyltransferase [Thermoleophilaceae bacterium]